MTHHLRISNYKATLAKYDHTDYGKFSKFIEFLLEEKKEQFRALISEGQLISRTALQTALDSADTAAQSTDIAIVMR